MRQVMMSWVMIMLAGCAGEKTVEKPAEAPAAPAAAAPLPPATVAIADFKYLGYLHGDWRGTMANRQFFYERYVRLNDSTIASFTLDSTYNIVSDSGQIRWSNGQVRTGSDGRSYVATVWTADSVRFDPEGGTNNSFVWIRQSADAWLARLQPRNGGMVQYSMERTKKPRKISAVE